MKISKKVLLVGSGPLPNEPENIRDAAGLRTEQFLSPLLQSHHQVKVFCIYNSPVKQQKEQGIIRAWRGDSSLVRQLRQTMSTFKPEVVIGVNTFPSFLVSQCIEENIPFWADLNGWIMAEAQARGFSDSTNIHLANAWHQEKSILKRADRISTVSEAQKFATIGELASIGQLRHEYFLKNKVISIPNCTKWFDIDKTINVKNVDIKTLKRENSSTTSTDKKDSVETSKNYKKTEIMFNIKEKNKPSINEETDVEQNKEMFIYKEKKRDKKGFEEKVDNIDKFDNLAETQNMFRSIKTPEEAFIVGWIGGYNNWVDEKMLFEGLENAMQQIPHLYFVSTGGGITNVANTPFHNFQKRIKTSVYKNRFIFLGWIDTKDMQKVYSEIDIGINVDYLCIETETGARNRITEMMKFGVPVVSTKGSEVAKIVEEYNSGIAIEYGNPSYISDAIVKMSKLSKEERKRLGDNGQKVIFEILTENIVQKPVLDFVDMPCRSCLHPLPIEGIMMFFQNVWWYLKNKGWKAFFAKIMQKIY